MTPTRNQFGSQLEPKLKVQRNRNEVEANWKWDRRDTFVESDWNQWEDKHMPTCIPSATCAPETLVISSAPMSKVVRWTYHEAPPAPMTSNSFKYVRA